jgi:DNA-binding response OmpR family regulator
MVEKILMIDDDEDDADLFCSAVNIVDSNIVCVKAFNGHEGLELIKAGLHPDLIFLDLNMPVFDGKRCLAELRKVTSLASVPVIMYTTSKRVADIAETTELGADYFMTKPTTLSQLCAEISFLLLKKWDRVTNFEIYRR